MDADKNATYNLLHFIADVLYFIGNRTPDIFEVCWNWPYTIAIVVCVWSLLCFALFLRISWWVLSTASAIRRLAPV
jgi:hypothetical protein